MVIVISNETVVNDEMTTINELFKAGLDRFHYRRSDFSLSQFQDFLGNVPSHHHSKISVHLDAFIPGLPKGIGVHYKSTYVGARYVDRLESSSIHSLEELEGSKGDYHLVAPVFPSISKPGHGVGENIKNEVESLQACSKLLVALGGIDVKSLAELGSIWKGVALKGAIWKEGDVKNRVAVFKELKQKWKESQH